MINVLVVGAGTMGVTHLRAYQKMPHAKVVGVVDIRTPEKIKNDGYQIFTSIEDAIEVLKNIDVIDICLPTYLHKKYVTKAAKLKKHVICEKPLSNSLEEAEEIINVCKQNKVKLFVGHVVRFFPEYQQARKHIQAGTIGHPGVMRTSRTSGMPNAWNDWYTNYKSSGGLILDLIIHDFDFLRWCFGEVSRVYAKSLLGREYAKKDYALVTLRFESGVIAHVEGSWSHQTFSMKFEFSGEKGIIEYDSSKEKPLITEVSQPTGLTSGVSVPKSPLNETPYYRELAHFIECIEEDKESIVTPNDAYKAIEIALAALQSAKTNQPIHLK